MANASSSPDATAGKSGQPPVVIKKYANRRLYNTETSSYITLDHLAGMTRAGRDFQVFDARTGEDITRSVLTQIVMEGEAGGQTMLPTSFLRQIIALYGDSMQSMVPHYLEASMEAFAENQVMFRTAAMKPFEHMARQNLAMFQAATEMLTGGRLRDSAARAAKKPASAAPPQPPPQSPPQPTSTPTNADEVAQLKAQLAAIQARIDGLKS